MSHRVTLLAGDTPALLEPVQGLIAAAGADIDWDTPDESLDALVASARSTKVVLMGWRRGRRAQGELPPAVQLRRTLGVQAQRRIVCGLPGLPARVPEINLVVIRETTEGIYTHLEHESIEGVFESLKVTTREACERIARHAMDYAVANNRRKVTIVHKSNIMKQSDGMFLRIARAIGHEYPQLEVDEFIVDALCMRLVLDPSRFDVLVTDSLYGDIISDMCAGLAGRGNAPSENVTGDGTVLFTSSNGDSVEHAGTDNANPLILLIPALRMLRHLGLHPQADRLKAAMTATLSAGTLPVASGGTATWPAFCAAVEQALS